MTDLLRAGDRSPKVSEVQERLRDLGYPIDDNAGHFGPATTRAIRTFQQGRDILVDGIVGPHTWAELAEASFRLGDRVLYLTQPPVRGDDVVALQQRLNGLGFDSGREDGIYGRNTAEAVRLFQKEYAVSEDGIFGPRTHAALIGLRVAVTGASAALREELRRVERSGIHEASIVIDPGHGGGDHGEVGRAGLLESEVCWDLASRLADRLIGRGAKVGLTREAVESPDSTERARRANEFGADLLIAIHLNAHETP
ncbi:MAG: N-acetylmuramoyl-L-alanine amidase, partial [Actinomycetota bacterium]